MYYVCFYCINIPLTDLSRIHPPKMAIKLKTRQELWWRKAPSSFSDPLRISWHLLIQILRLLDWSVPMSVKMSLFFNLLSSRHRSESSEFASIPSDSILQLVSPSPDDLLNPKWLRSGRLTLENFGLRSFGCDQIS